MATNLGLLYNKIYFENIRWDTSVNPDKEIKHTFIDKNKADETLKQKFSVYKANEAWLKVATAEGFQLKTTYPGLLIGIGNEHEVGIDNEFKLGFHFDHTSGLPLIPGSSVKGLLRSVFKHETLVGHLLHKNSILSVEEIEKMDLKTIESELFDGIVNNKPLPMSERDIFHDAYIIHSAHHDGLFMGNDYITPHKQAKRKDAALDAMASPTPLQLLKVLPNVIFQFQFEAKDSLNYDCFTAEKKIKLFKAIITTIGVGAKTSVGYGFLVENTYNAKANDSGKIEVRLPKAKQDKEAIKAAKKATTSPDLDLSSLLNSFNQ
jgi:CRISPR-associated protein Cmr6